VEVIFCVDIGFVNSTRRETFDSEEDFGLTEEEWKNLSVKDKDELIVDWSSNYVNLWIEED